MGIKITGLDDVKKSFQTWVGPRQGFKIKQTKVKNGDIGAINTYTTSTYQFFAILQIRAWYKNEKLPNHRSSHFLQHFSNSC